MRENFMWQIDKEKSTKGQLRQIETNSGELHKTKKARQQLPETKSKTQKDSYQRQKDKVKKPR